MDDPNRFEPWVEATLPLEGHRRFREERVWLIPTPEEGEFRLGHPPFLSADYERGDRVSVRETSGRLEVAENLLPGGHLSYRVLFPGSLEPEELRLKIQQLEDYAAFCHEASNAFFVIDISPEANANAIKAQLQYWAKRGLAQCAFEAESIPMLALALLDEPHIPCALPEGPTSPSVSIVDVVEGDAPVLHVVHMGGEVPWQFLGWQTPTEDEARLATLHFMVSKDPSLNALAGLPTGWHAWRESDQHPWQAEPYAELE